MQNDKIILFSIICFIGICFYVYIVRKLTILEKQKRLDEIKKLRKRNKKIRSLFKKIENIPNIPQSNHLKNNSI